MRHQNKLLFSFCALILSAGLLIEAQETSNWKRFELDNGLVFFVQEDHSADVVSHHIFVLTGSRNEAVGKTNLSHFIEHLRWGGHEGEEPYEKKLQALGGSTGGHTFPDFTDYIDIGPSSALELMIRSGAEFLSGLETDETRFQTEREVMLSEDLLASNNPNFVAIRNLISIAFQAHPYKNPPGGWRTDTARLSLKDAKDYFNTYYTPANTVVFIAGDLDVEHTVKEMTTHYGALPKKKKPPEILAVEPPQNAEKCLRFKAPVSNPSIWVGYHVPGIAHEDVPTLQVMYSLLCNGLTSLLKKSLIDELKIASSINPYGAERRQWRKDPSLLVFGTALKPGVSAEEGKFHMISVIENLAKEMVREADLKRAIKKEITARMTYILYSVWKLWYVSSRTQQAGYYYALTGDPDYAYRLIDGYKKVTPQSLQKIASKYLREDNRTSVLMIPQSDSKISKIREH
jgi:zinc protease